MRRDQGSRIRFRRRIECAGDMHLAEPFPRPRCPEPWAVDRLQTTLRGEYEWLCKSDCSWSRRWLLPPRWDGKRGSPAKACRLLWRSHEARESRKDRNVHLGQLTRTLSAAFPGVLP